MSSSSLHKLITMINGRDYPFLKSFPTSYASKVYNLKRLGTEYGGWKIPVNKIEKNSICYCVGAGEDISFDVKLVTNFGCSVHIFDPTPRAENHFKYLENCVSVDMQAVINPFMKSRMKRFYPILKRKQFDKLKFFPYGIWSKSEIRKFYAPLHSEHVSHSITNVQHVEKYFEAKCVTIKEMMHQLGHDKLEILKLDIEGAEYDVIDSILYDDIKIKILCVELHGPQNSCFLDRSEKCIEKLVQAGFTPLFRSDFDFTLMNKKV